WLWQMDITMLLAAAIRGTFISLDIIFIILGAILLLNVMRTSGAINSINQTFSGISNDRRIQIIIIAWLFGGFVEGASGFGAAPALAAPLLAGLGFPPLIAAGVSLICNTLPVPFGAVGIPAKTSVSCLEAELTANGMNIENFRMAMLNDLTMFSGISGVFLPLLAIAFMIVLAGGKRKMRSIVEIAPLALFSAAAYIIPWRLTALWFGPELPSMTGALVGLPLTIIMVKRGFLVPAHVWDFPGENDRILPQPENSCRMIPAYQAWMPYLLLAAVLMVIRFPGSPIPGFLAKFRIILPDMFAIPDSGSSWAILLNPGLTPIAIIAVASALIWKIPSCGISKIAKDTWHQTAPSAIAIAASTAVVQIMVASETNNADIPGMLNCVAIAAANGMGRFFAVISPFIGIFGTFFAGSCTVSNILFSPLQFKTALYLGLDPALCVALQNIGGGLGSMIRISGVIAACATVNISGKEGRLIMLNSIPAAIMALLAVIAALIAG
ncbi:MAG: L-lactate permease, partial [Lentisphaeria bacterium]|nr:L-lactate permease [Lentisphaeria bacterium]